MKRPSVFAIFFFALTTLRSCYYEHPRRSVRTSASVDTDICVGRYGHLRRSVRTSASVGADICIGRCASRKRLFKTIAVASKIRQNVRLD